MSNEKRRNIITIIQFNTILFDLTVEISIYICYNIVGRLDRFAVKDGLEDAMKKIISVFLVFLSFISLSSCENTASEKTADEFFDRVIISLFVSSDSVDKDGNLICDGNTSPQISIGGTDQVYGRFAIAIYDKSDSDRLYMYCPRVDAHDILQGALNEHMTKIKERQGNEHTYRLEVYAIADQAQISAKTGKKCDYEKTIKEIDGENKNLLGFGYIEFKK